MIFVTVGTHKQPFDRLIEKLDKLVAERKIDDKIIAQIGYCKYEPKNFSYFRFTSLERMEKLFTSANLVITHGGIGSVFLSLRKGKKTIVIPRMKRFGEHSDDHQLQVAKELGKQKMVISVYDIHNLASSIKISRNFSFTRIQTKNTIVDTIKTKLGEWEKLHPY